MPQLLCQAWHPLCFYSHVLGEANVWAWGRVIAFDFPSGLVTWPKGIRRYDWLDLREIVRID